MSFSKASLKRFNENTGCAPPVGAYDPKQKDKAAALAFDKGGDRFKLPKDVGPGPGAFDLDTQAKKAALNASTCSNGSEKRKVSKSTDNLAEMSKIKDLEREIKKLVQERVNQDKLLTQRESDIVKLEGRLQVTQADKIALQAKIASLEKELKEVKKSNEVLKNKMTTVDSTVKKQENMSTELSSLKYQLENKTKEITKLKTELENAQCHHSADLQTFENVVKALEEKVQKFDLIEVEHTNGKKDKKKSESDERNGKQETSHKQAEKLQKRFHQAIEEYDSKINQYKTKMEEKYGAIMEDKQTLEQNLQQVQEELNNAVEKSEDIENQRAKLSKQYESLQKMIKDIRSASWNQEDNIRYLKGEVFTMEDYLKEEGQILFEVKAERASLLEKLDNLEEENGTLNENIKNLTEKYHELEGQLADEQNHNNVKSDQIQSQLDITKCHLMQIQDEYQSLQNKNKEIVHSVNKEKENVEKLIFEMDEQKQLSSDLQNLLVDKDDKITDLEILLEATKVELQHVMASVEAKEEEMLEQKEKLMDLEATERALRGQIDQENEINMKTVRQHADRILELENTEISVTEENIKLCKQVEESKENILITEERLKSVTCDLETVQEEYKVKVESLTSQLKLVLEEKESLQKELELVHSELKELKKEVVCLQDKLKMKVDEVDKEKQSQIESVQEMTSNIQQLFQEKQNLISKIEALSSELNIVKADNVVLMEQMNELEKLKKDKNSAESKLKQLDVKLGSLNKENTQLMNEIEFLQQSKDHGSKEFSKTVERLEKEVKVCKEKEEMQSKIISEHVKSLENAKLFENELESEKVELTSKLNEVTSQKEAISKQFSDLITSLEEMRGQSAEKEEEWKCDYQRLTNEFQTVTEERDVLLQRLTSIEEEKSALGELIKHLETKVENLEEGSQKEISAAKDKVNQLLEEKENILHENQMLKSTNENFQKVLDEKMLQTQSLENDVEKLVQEVNIYKDFKVKYEVKDREVSDVRQEVSVKVSEIDSLQETLTELESSKQLLNQQVSEMDNLVGSLRVENSRLEKEVETKESVIDRITAKYETEITSLKTEIESSVEKNSDLHETIQCLEDTVKELEQEGQKSGMKIKELENYISSTENQAIKTMEDLSKLLELAQDKEGQMKSEIQGLQSSLHSLAEEKEDMARHYEDELVDLRDKARTMEDTNWKKLYEDLMTKVEPFMEQLDAYEMEKAALLGRSKFAQTEMDKLSSAYAKLLGHQNQKQKIHHIVKIKEENNNLKRETATLREQVAKLKRSNQKLEDKVTGLEGKKRFDPSKAFQHKENSVPPSSPLKDGNRK